MKKSSIVLLFTVIIELLVYYSISLLNTPGHDRFVSGILLIIGFLNLMVLYFYPSPTGDKDKILVMDNETWISNLESRSAQAQADGDFKLHEYYEFQIRSAKASEAVWKVRNQESNEEWPCA